MTNTNTDTSEIIGTAASQTAAAIWESLEQRQMMSAAAGVTFVDGVLILRGNSAAGNDLAVNVSDDGQSIWGVTNNQSGEHIDIGKVRQIRIIGGEEADTVNVDGRIQIPVFIRTGNGNDSITSAGGNDTI